MSKMLDVLSEYLSRRKGLLPLIGIILIVVNLLLQLVLPGTWLAGSQLFLHIGVITAILGFMLARAL